ncbi:MAG: polysaccharide biosynthesis protein [Clostridia bacterium]|nr:polysaccharide biosynthesis protein [Clostridia bacterium]
MNRKLKLLAYVIFDFLAIGLSWTLSIILLRYDADLCIVTDLIWMISGIILALLLNVAFGLYARLWRYVSIDDALKIFLSCAIWAVYTLVVAYVSELLTIEWAIITSFFYLSLIFVSRFIFRFYQSIEGNKKKNKKRVLFIGAGDTADNLIREIKNTSNAEMYPVCALDDSPFKLGQTIHGVPIVGRTGEVQNFASKYNIDEIVIAMPSAPKRVISKLVTESQKTGCKVKAVPAFKEIVSGKVSISDIKEVDVVDLLGRDVVDVNAKEIMGYIEGKTVLVTGGGGSIGSELCRQIATKFPKRLIIVDIYENNAYDIQQELKRQNPDLDLVVLIASVRDRKKIESIFKKYKPQIVFHAAAHKHVPLMEDSPNEAIKNNVHGTHNVANAAGKFKAEKFVLISTDKAVNPTNIMGATKRICEMIVQSLAKTYNTTEYAAVRFGNVLGSNGSVIPLFKRQIKEGGPVTVTHKDIVRYFMTIPEAVSLVLQAGAYAKGGEIFVLDMGEPVKIYDLAINMIRLSGFEPFKDIDIMVTGLRPGEKLYEERLMKEEGLKKTANDMISIGKPIKFDEKTFISKIEELYKLARKESEGMKDLVKELVPTYVVYKDKK